MQRQSQAGQPHAVSLTWQPPPNFSAPKEVSHYYVKVSSKISNRVLKELEVSGESVEVDLSGDDPLEPLQEYIFAVQALGCNHQPGDWNMVDGFVGESRSPMN